MIMDLIFVNTCAQIYIFILVVIYLVDLGVVVVSYGLV